MLIIPARIIYFSLVAVVVLVFIGGGLYVSGSAQQAYYRSLHTQQSNRETTIEQTAKPEKEIQPNLQTDNSSAAGQKSLTSAPAKTQTFGSLISTAEGCYTKCDYSYQCPNQLECVDQNGTNYCVDPSCPEDNTCSCSFKHEDPPILSKAQQNMVESERGVGGRTMLAQVNSTPSPTPRPTISPSPTPRSTVAPAAGSGFGSTSLGDDDGLLTAGNQNITVVLAVFSVILLGGGFLYLRKNA